MFLSDSLRPAPKATPQLSRALRPRQGVMPAAHDTARGRYLLPRLRADADEASGGFKIGYMRFFESAPRNIAPANMPHRYCMYRLCCGTDARSAGRVSSLGAHDVAHVVSLLGHRRPESVYRELARLDVYRVQLPDLRRQHRAVVLAPSPSQPRQDLYLPPLKVTGRPGPLELWRGAKMSPVLRCNRPWRPMPPPQRAACRRRPPRRTRALWPCSASTKPVSALRNLRFFLSESAVPGPHRQSRGGQRRRRCEL